MEFNFCAYLDHSTCFARLNSLTATPTCLTDESYLPASYEIISGDDKTTGIQFTQDSDHVCKTASDGTEINYSFTAQVMCDKDITGQGAAQIESVDFSNECKPVVTVKHAAGCHTFTANPVIKWLSNNPWVLAIFFFFVGPIIAVFGKRWFPYVIATISSLAIITTIVFVGAFHGCADTLTGLIILLIAALAAGIVGGLLIRRAIWIGVGLTGIVAGFCLGSFLYGCILATTGWQSYWGALAISISLAIVGGILTFTLGKQIIILFTSLIGSYLFTRAITLVADEGYPSEAEIYAKLKNDEPIELDWHFWL